MTLVEAEELTNLVILDQVGNQLIDKYRQNPSSLNHGELTTLGDILNYYYAGGNSLSHIQSMLTNYPGATLKPNDYLFNKGTGGEYEKMFWGAATQRNINKQVSDVASLGGDAVFAAPGKGILAKLRNRKFFHLDELNDVLTQELVILNAKTTKRYPESRYTCFSKTDQQFLNPLPSRGYEVCQWTYHLKVSEFYTVTLEGVGYSVPYQFIGQYVDAKMTDRTIDLYLNRELIASHARILSGNSILNEHMPRNHQLQDEMQPDRLVAWAQSIGVQTSFVIQKILSNKSGYANNFKKLNQLKRYLFENKVPALQVEQGFDYIQKLNINAIDRIVSVFKNKVYQKNNHLIVPTMEELDVAFSKNQTHENIRGSSYYTNQYNTISI